MSEVPPYCRIWRNAGPQEAEAAEAARTFRTFRFFELLELPT